MKTTIEMAREAGLFTHKEVQAELKAFEALVRADERKQALEHLCRNAHPIVERAIVRALNA
jgi:hypothetical protein